MSSVGDVNGVSFSSIKEDDAADIEVSEQEELFKKSVEHSTMIKAVFGTSAGKKYLEYLKETFLNRSIARRGDDILEIGIRQGEADIVRKIVAEIEREI